MPRFQHCCYNRPPSSRKGNWIWVSLGLPAARCRSFPHLLSPTHRLGTGGTQASDGVWVCTWFALSPAFGASGGPGPVFGCSLPRGGMEPRTGDRKSQACAENQAPLRENHCSEHLFTHGKCEAATCPAGGKSPAGSQRKPHLWPRFPETSLPSKLLLFFANPPGPHRLSLVVPSSHLDMGPGLGLSPALSPSSGGGIKCSLSTEMLP